MNVLKRYWYYLIITVVTLGLGVVTFLTTQKLTQTKPVAPTVPQEKPKAVAPECRLTFSVVQPTATPTSTPGPTATPTPTPTPNPASNTVPECTGLSVSPGSGTVPLTIVATCSGLDYDGDITAADFDFGDGNTKKVEKNVGSPGSESASYTFDEEGTYDVSCKVQDTNGAYSSTPDACKKSVTAREPAVADESPSGGTQVRVPTATPTPKPSATPTPYPITDSPLQESSPVPTLVPTATPTLPPVEGPTPKVPVAGSGPGVLGVATIAGGFLLLLLGLVF